MNTIRKISLKKTYTDAKKHSEEKSLLFGKLDLQDKRYPSFLLSFILMKKRSVKTIVETGTARDGVSNFEGDGGSTILFGNWIAKYGGELFSIDINQSHLVKAAEALKDQTGRVYFIHSDSIKFLKEFNKQIDFLYLDSYDYDIKNPLPSQEHHLHEIMAAYPCLTKKSIVMIDDCKLKNGGKGKLVVKFLAEKGWKIVYEGYQIILVQS